jgi:hypothetical protein
LTSVLIAGALVLATASSSAAFIVLGGVMSDISVLHEGGILGAEEVVTIAKAAGLELAAAATLLVKESGGGRNVWGHDAVTVAPNTYVKGGPVTQSNYTAYITAVTAGRAGRQGCGPTQLTYGPFQQRADDAGGCWQWEVNCRVGFEILADHIRRRGVQDGFRAYNGSGHRAEAYGRDAKTKYDMWRVKLEEDDMPTADDIAAAVWRYGIRNGFGDTVQAHQILAAGEKRTADAQDALAALAVRVEELHKEDGVDADAIKQAVAEALAARP